MILPVLAAACAAAWLVWRFVPKLRAEMGGDAPSRRLPSLDGLRGILCIAVLLHHAAITQEIILTGKPWPRPASPFFDLLGHSAVAFFFAITGFLFWGRIVEHGFRSRWFAFYRGRVFRIVPLYMLLAAIAAVLLLTHPNAGDIGSARLASFFGEVFSFGFKNWTSIDAGTRTIRPQNFDAGVHWTLRYEWMFYFLLPIFALFARSWRPILLFAVAIGLAIWTGPLNELPISIMFLVGMAGAHAVRSPKIVAVLTKRSVGVGVFICVVLLLYCAVPRAWMLGIWPTRNGSSPLAVVLTLFIFTPIAAGQTVFGLLAWPTLRLLGLVSYSIYLMHGIVLYVARPWIVPLVKTAGTANIRYWLAIALLAAITTWLSCITFWFIERPFIKASHASIRRP